MKLKRGQKMKTEGCPAMGGFPAVEPEVVTVLRKAQIDVPGYWVVRFESDGARLAMHESRMVPA